MTITIAWWWFPIGFVLLGIVAALAVGGKKSDYDMFSPLFGAACLLLGIAAAIAFCFGRWLA